MKTCSKCKEQKPLDGFNKSSAHSDGAYPSCKTCKRAADRAYTQRPEVKARAQDRVRRWREDNPAKRDAYTKFYAQSNRDQLRDRDRVAYHRAQSALARTAVNHGNEWTGPELEVINRDDLTAKEMASMLGRTLAAVMHQRKIRHLDPRKDRLAGISHEAKTPSAATDGVS